MTPSQSPAVAATPGELDAHDEKTMELAVLRKALESLVAECREVQRYVSGEGSDDESGRFDDALKEAESAIAALSQGAKK